MLLFAFAVVVALLGVGVYDLYNPGPVSITMAGHHFAAVPVWVPVALGAAVPLSFFLLHAVWTGVRIWLLKRALRRQPAWEIVRPWPAAETWPAAESRTAPVPARLRRPAREQPAVAVPSPTSRRRRASQAPPPQVGPQPAPKRSWLDPRD